MRVLKRSGFTEDVSFDKVLNRIKNLSDGLNIDVYDVSQKVCSRIYDNVRTSELDELAAHICSSLIIEHPDYGVMAAKIIVSNHQKNTSPSFSETIQALYDNIDSDGEKCPLVSDKLYNTVMKNKEKLNNYIDYARDFNLDYFGFKTLERAYLMRIGKKVIERPQHMFMRVAIGIHGEDIKDALQTYDLMSKKYFTHATPTLFNAGTPRPQCSSCYLQASNDDSISGIYESLGESAQISKYAGGIGIHIHDIRARGSRIRGTNGTSTGIIPMLRVFNNTARYVNQCFTPDTIVFSRDGAKRMDDITTRDHLMTHDGSFKRVNGISKQFVEKPILEFQTKYAFDKVRVTDEHEIYVIPNQHLKRDNNIEVILKRLENGSIKPGFVFAKDVCEGDYVGYPVPTYIDDDTNITADFCRFYAIMIKNGSIRENIYRVNTRFESTRKFLLEYLNNHGIKYYIHNESISWFGKCGSEPCSIQEKDLLKDGEKYIIPKFMHLPEEKVKSFINGILDECTMTDSTKTVVKCENLSYQCVMAIKYMLLRIGRLCSGYLKEKIKYNIVETNGNKRRVIEVVRDIYDMFIPLDDDTVFEYEGLIWTKVNKIKKIDYVGEVYDFNMMDNHNYTVANLGLVHNSGKRNGSIAVYLEPWHADVEAFLELRKNHGNEEERARDLFLALWIPDLFMERVKNNQTWSLMCPDKCKGLSGVYGEEFVKLYMKYEKEGKYVKQVNAQELWFKILESQIETGTPYLLYKDAANKKSNQKNLGTIKSSNLCVGPETLILTKDGYFPIYALENAEVEVWNGSEFSKTIVHKTGTDKKVLTIEFSNGQTLECTPYHKFYIEGVNNEVKVVDANDLKLGMKIMKYSVPVLKGVGLGALTLNMNGKLAYTSGLYSSYACNSNNKDYMYIYNKHKKLLPSELSWVSYHYDINNNRYVVEVPYDVSKRQRTKPPLEYDIETRVKWLEGYVDGDGRIMNNNITVVNYNRKFLQEVALMMQTLGIMVNIYNFKNMYKLVIDRFAIKQLIDFGFAPKILDITGIHTGTDKQFYRYVTITGVYDNNEYKDTYCFNEPKKHMGVFNGILTGNCSEIIEYSAPDEIAVCNLASICLPTYVEYDDEGKPKYNFEKLHEIAKIITKNLNKVIDLNFYPVEKARVSNLRHRPIGIGVQGLADAFALMRLPFESQEASQLNKDIFETIYHGAMEASMEIAKKRHQYAKQLMDKQITEEMSRGLHEYLKYTEFDPDINSDFPGAYSTFVGSPTYLGQFQFDLWGIEKPSNRYDWNELKKEVMTYGVRNSLLLAPMPTASTSQIMGFNESFEAFTSNMYKRKTLAGEFVVINKYLMNDLIKMGIWNKSIRDKIIMGDGSIQHIDEIPTNIKELYKTVWEIKQKVVIDQAVDRGYFVCQSQSMNLYMEDPDFKKLTSMHFYAWSKGLKTGVYYLRSKPKAQTQKFTMDPSLVKKEKVVERNIVCTDEVCTMCSA